MMLTFVGSGGKTTAIFELAASLLSRQKKVLVTTTTHLHTPQAFTDSGRFHPLYVDKHCCLTGSPVDILSQLSRDGFCIAALPSEDPKKLGPLPDDVLSAVLSGADCVLVEGDGSRGLPLKAPAAHEPVIPQGTDAIIVLCGLSALGKPLGQVCHRLPLALAHFDRTALTPCPDESTAVTPGLIQQLYTDLYLTPLAEHYPDIPVLFWPAQANTLYERTAASMLAARLDVSCLCPGWFSPQPHLVLLGAGHVSLALFQIAQLLGYRVTVIDDREDFVSLQRFPQAQTICCDFSTLENCLPTEPGTFYAVLTRGHQWDSLCVETILKKNPSFGYLGMIGSRTKVAHTMDALRQKGFSEEQLSSICAPIGLKLGGQTPEEIAVSIAAQLIQVRNAGNAAFLSPELARLQQKKEPNGVLALILSKTGSAPRGAGSMMVLETDGALTGTIGGGSLEFEATKELQRMLDRPAAFPPARICRFDVSNEEGAVLGMVCGGSVTVLLAQLNPSLSLTLFSSGTF